MTSELQYYLYIIIMCLTTLNTDHWSILQTMIYDEEALGPWGEDLDVKPWRPMDLLPTPVGGPQTVACSGKGPEGGGFI